jgi:hypothetical protein
MHAVSRARGTWAVSLAIVVVTLLAPMRVESQVTGLFYREVQKGGRYYVFNTAERAKAFATSGEMGTSITLIGRGPNGETVVAENETALDLFLFKHNLPGYERPAPKVPAPVIPTVLKIGDGELKLSGLIQGWYLADDTEGANNTFRIRRVEIKLSGKITPNWGFEVMIDPSKSQDFATGKDSKILQDAAISFIGLKGHEIALGQKKITFTDEGVRSSSELDFAERAQIIRAVSDRREAGLFYKGAFGTKLNVMAALTNGTANNVNDDSNDTLVSSLQLELTAATGLAFGISGSHSSGETKAHLERSRYAAHLRYDGPESAPIGIRAEYVQATDGQAGKADLERDGYYATFMYTIAKQYRFALRYDSYNKNADVDGNEVNTITAGFHYLIKGKNINLKLDWLRIEEQGRKVGGKLAEDYNQAILAAQVAF